MVLPARLSFAILSNFGEPQVETNASATEVDQPKAAADFKMVTASQVEPFRRAGG